MRFKATKEQVAKMAAIAISASTQHGLGFLQSGETLNADDVLPFIHEINGRSNLSLDYVHGRMVKLHLHELEPDVWSTDPIEPRGDYQSWCGKYPTYRALVEAAGCVVIGE